MEVKIETTFLEQTKKAVNTALFNSCNGMNPVDMNILFIKYIMMHDKFAEDGIYITDKNKEEKYIEIIEKDNPDLLSLLEDYLQIQEQLEKIIKIRDQWKETIQKLDDIAKTEDANNKDVIISTVKPFFEYMDSKFRNPDDPNNLKTSESSEEQQ